MIVYIIYMYGVCFYDCVHAYLDIYDRDISLEEAHLFDSFWL